MFTGKD
jgi:hypothetical protein